MPIRWAVPMLMAAALSGCGAIGAIGLHPFEKKEAAAEPPVTAAPTGAVETAALPPADGAAPPASASEMAIAPTGTGTPPVANGAPLVAGATVNRTDLLGGWTLTNGTESCQLFMTLTSWTGGYRASTRGCTSDTLKSIAAWNIEGKDVVLVGAGGAKLAQLAAADQGRFNGQLVGNGAQVSFYR